MAVMSLSELLLLAVAALATLEVYAQVNAEIRVDNLQDPVMNVTVVGGPDTALFDSCATQAFTFSARFSSIKSSADLVYNRHVPSTTYNVTFTAASSTTPINSTIDCADYAGSVGASMFMYDGSKCQYVNNTIYDTTVPEDCGSAAKPAVFVQENFTAPCGQLPSFSYINGTTKACYAANVAQALSGGKIEKCTLPLHKYASNPLTYQLIKPYLISMGVTSDLFFDYKGGDLTWAFLDNTTITAQDFVDGNLPLVNSYDSPNTGSDILYMSAAHGFKLKIGPIATTNAGMLCEGACSTC